MAVVAVNLADVIYVAVPRAIVEIQSPRKEEHEAVFHMAVQRRRPVPIIGKPS